MFNRDNRSTKSVAAVSTLIGPGTLIHGDVSFSGGLHLDGTIEGALRSNGANNAILTISDKGSVSGEIQVPNVVVNGTVKGDIIASERLELAEQARIEGNVYYKLLEMAAGAQISGKIVHQAEAPKQLMKPETSKASEVNASAKA